MARLADEQQAALRKFKQEALGVSPPGAGISRTTTPSPRSEDRGHIPLSEVARVVGCETSDVLMTLRRLGYTKKTPDSRLTVGEAEAVREHWTSAASSDSRPTLPLGLLASELGVNVQLLALEAKRSGIPVLGSPERFMLFKVEAEHLRRFAASSSEKLVRRTAPPVGLIRTTALTGTVARQEKRLTAQSSQVPASTINVKAGTLAPTTPQKFNSAAPTVPRRAAANIPSAVALAPPKPAAVVDIQRALVARSKSIELDPDSKPIASGATVMSDVQPLPTTIGKGSPEVDALQQTLGGFAPKDHAVLFRELSAVLDLDDQIVRSLSSDTSYSGGTDRVLRSLMRLVCRGKFGLFAYHEVSNIVRAAARRNGQNSTQAGMANALTNLRPMHTGVLTDSGKSRFIFWHVEDNGTTLAIVTFGAVTDWVFGIDRGQYVPLRGRLIPVARGTRLGVDDREDAQFMVEACDQASQGSAHPEKLADCGQFQSTKLS